MMHLTAVECTFRVAPIAWDSGQRKGEQEGSREDPGR